ncbi:hypothetical protein [Labilithrix luteola]|nr:hypothetical protein [Labilithrix luteola]
MRTANLRQDMTRFMRRRALLVLPLSVIAGVTALVACANNESSSSEPDSANVIPDASPPDLDAGLDANVDGDADAGCVEGDPNCTTKVVSCDEVEWCMAATPLSVLKTFTAVWGTSKTDVWAIGSGGTIYHYDGTQWVDTPSGVFNTLYGIWGSSANDIWVVSDPMTVLHGTGFKNGTATWELVPTGFSKWNTTFLRAVWGTSPDDVRFGGRAYDISNNELEIYTTGHQLLKKTNGDGSIGFKTIEGTPTVYSYWGSSATDVWMAADNHIYASSERGLIMHGTPRPDPKPSSDPLSTVEDPLLWAKVDSQSNLTLESIWGSSKDDIWAVGGNGAIRNYKTGDVRFEKVESGTIANLHAVWGSGPNDIWAVGDTGTILHYDGKTVTPSTVQLPVGRKPNLYGVWGSGADDVWVVGDGIALHYTGNKTGGAK